MGVAGGYDFASGKCKLTISLCSSLDLLVDQAVSRRHHEESRACQRQQCGTSAQRIAGRGSASAKDEESAILLELGSRVAQHETFETP